MHIYSFSLLNTNAIITPKQSLTHIFLLKQYILDIFPGQYM